MMHSIFQDDAILHCSIVLFGVEYGSLKYTSREYNKIGRKYKWKIVEDEVQNPESMFYTLPFSERIAVYFYLFIINERVKFKPVQIQTDTIEIKNTIFMNRTHEHTARAHANIALVKYWGKQDAVLNLPAVGSISMTLDALHTTTSCRFDDSLKNDRFALNQKEASPSELKRVTKFLDLIRHQAEIKMSAEIHSKNNFPTGAGLASSASGFAALALAASRAAGLETSPRELSILARQGSGSAARSVYGGFVEMKTVYSGSVKENVTLSNRFYAEQLYNENYWDIRLIVAVISDKSKKTSSRDGMNLSARTSPYYQAWVNSAADDIAEMQSALEDKDFEKLGELSEYSCLKMHALTFSSRPGFFYWQPETLGVMLEVRDLRKQGIPAYFTIDAGPQVKVLCLPEHQQTISEKLAAMPTVQSVISTKPGPGVFLMEDN